MAKYSNLLIDVNSIFAASSWTAENIKTFPDNFIKMDAGNEFIRVSVVPSGLGINVRSVSGVMIIDIFAPSGNGPKRSLAIADKLDLYLSGKSVTARTGVRVQFGGSSLSPLGTDRDNPALYRVTYTIPFNYFEV